MKIFGDTINLLNNFNENYLTRYVLNPGNYEKMINMRTILPVSKLFVLNEDESINYEIPQSDIIKDSVQYSESYQNGSRRTLSFNLVNIKRKDGTYPYIPNVNGLWYGTKIMLNIGFNFQGQDYMFARGIYILNSFTMTYSNTDRNVSFQAIDKFGLFDGTTGVLDSGYEIPVNTQIDEAIKSILNLSTSDGTTTDIKLCNIDSKFSTFETQQTISINAGQTMANLFEQLGEQMSAEYYYDNNGHLTFVPLDDSLNEHMKPIIWRYTAEHLGQLEFSFGEDVVNVVKVTGSNVNNNQMYQAISKNTNLTSPINIYYIKERYLDPIDSPNVWSDKMAQDLADYNLKLRSILQLKQTVTVPYNPILSVNNIIEITVLDLGMKREQFLINSISYTSGSPTMNLEIVNLNYLPTIGGVGMTGFNK